MKRVSCTAVMCAIYALQPMFAAPPAFVDITWISISNMYYELGPLNIVRARRCGSKTTCLQAQAESVPAERCRVVDGGEAIPLSEGVTMRLDRNGVRPIANAEVKKALGFN